MAPKYGPFAAGAGFSLGQDDWLDHLGPMFQGDGVNTVNFGGTSLQVRGNSSGMQVLVGPGDACVRGGFYDTDVDVIVTVPANTSGSARVDRVVLRSDRNHAGGGQTYPFLIPGSPGAGAPAITQVEGGIWDLPLAKVNVAAGATGIAPENVTDDRVYLPLHVYVIDSRQVDPLTTDIHAKLVYDKNPAFNCLRVHNGTTWEPVITTDQGMNLGLNSPWSSDTYGPQVFRYGRHVEFRASLQPSVPGGPGWSNLITTLPAWARPNSPRQFPCLMTNVGTAGDFSTGVAFFTIYPDGSVTMASGTNLNLRQPDGSSGRVYATTRFEFDCMFTAAT